MKVAFVTNFCPHYRVQTFELLAQKIQVDYYFFSEGKEWYWQMEHGVKIGNFDYHYLQGFTIGKMRINPGLPKELINGRYDVYLNGISGKFSLLITFLSAKLVGKPFILWTGIWMKLQTFTHKLIHPFTRYIYQHSDAIVVYGSHVKDFLIDQGVSGDKVFIAHHSLDNNAYMTKVSKSEKDTLLDKLNIGRDTKIVLYLGRLEASKGIDILLSSFSKLPGKENYCLIIAGSGNEEHHLKQKSRELGIFNQTRFPGYVPNEFAIIYYSISSVFVLPSITLPTGKEPWGLVVNEAFNQGVPVIVSDAVGAAAGGLVENEVNGLVFPEGNSEILATLLDNLLGDSELWEFMSKNAKLKISKWNNDLMIAGFLDAINYVNNKVT